VAASASTSQASVAPEKKVKPSPISSEARSQPAKGARTIHIHQYSSVDVSSTTVPSRKENRRPLVSATTPVGISKSTIPSVNAAFAAKAWVLSSPASSRNSVFTPQIDDAASVVSTVSTR
jgi:hypothetical protein